MPYSRSFSTDPVTKFVTETREFRGEDDIAAIKAIVGTEPEGVPVRWITAGNGASVLATGKGGDTSKAVFQGRDREIVDSVEVRLFSDAKGREIALGFVPVVIPAFHVARARGTFIPAEGDKPAVYVVKTGLVESKDAPKVDTGDGLEGKTIQQLVTIAVTEGVSASVKDQPGAVITNIRAKRLKKGKDAVAA